MSDTHGQNANLCLVLERERNLDGLIHLGDSECGEIGIRQLVECPVYMVNGNCDFFSKLPMHQVIEIGASKILLIHGHTCFVTAGTRELARTARSHGCNVAMYGHTHVPLIDQSDPSLTILNPGSLTYPRQSGRRPSYLVMTVGEDGAAEYEVRYL